MPSPVWRPPRVNSDAPRDFQHTLRDYFGENMPSPMRRPAERMDQQNDDEQGPLRRNMPSSAGNYPQREQTPRMGINRPRPRETFEGERNRVLGDFDYDRLRPQHHSRYQERAGWSRPSQPHEAQRPEIRLLDQLLSNEPRPFFPSFSGRNDEWNSFWLKFELLARRYNWSVDKQREQLLLCLKDEAMNFAASLGPEIRGNLDLFVQALRGRFTHSTPAETVRASLNNIKKSSKETIQEYAARVRTLMAKGYPDIGCTETFTQMTIHHFLQGLPDQTIAYEVLIRKPNSLTEAIDMIAWHECCKESTRKKSNTRQIATFEEEQTAYPVFNCTSLDTEIRRINGKKFVTEERLIQFGRDLKMSIEKLFRDEIVTPEMAKDAPEEKGKDEVMPKRPERRKVICYKCHAEGHIASRCPNNDRGTVSAASKEKLSSNVTDAKEAENIKGLSLLAKTQSRF
ncbi:MAG: hypothetical protein AB2693_29635 [Candidatus Thiodiazotropha sp.]